MTATQIHEALDAMLVNPKTKNFLGHLVKNYFPATNTDKVWVTPEGPFKCVLTKDDLFSVAEILERFNTEEHKIETRAYHSAAIDGDFTKLEPLTKFFGNRKLGFTGKETTTYMSYEALQEFYQWVITKSLNGDKHINWLLGSVKGNFYGKVGKPVLEKKAIVSTYTLGETDAFKKLKEKFKDEN